MKKEHNKINRRSFLKTIGVAGLGPAFAASGAKQSKAAQKAEEPKLPQVPRRKLGKTGIEVPVLSLGGVYDADNQTIYRVAYKWGINCWDTANIYGGGNSEIGIGKFLRRNPQARKDLLIITKSSIFGRKGPGSYAPVTPDEVEKRLQLSLKRMNTDYIDLYYGVHELVALSQLSDEVRQWAEDAKKRKVIRFFGISTHRNTHHLAAVAKYDWVDVVQTPYNFRLMQNPEVQAAIEACYKAGMGIVAMKTLGLGQKTHTKEEEKIFEHFLKKGLTPEQAKIKYVLDDERVSTACVGMLDVTVLTSNVAAVTDKTKLIQADKNALEQYAKDSCSGYCAGCSHICDAALPDMPYTSKIMRYLMYHNSYGDKDRARELFAQIPSSVRDRLLSTDYSSAETRCPQCIPIGKLVAEAVSKLA